MHLAADKSARGSWNPKIGLDAANRRTRTQGQVTRKTRVILTYPKELAYAVTRLLNLWRGHWGIENRVHWVRDATPDEDRSQVRTGAAPQIMAALRNMTISLLRLASE